MTIQEEIKFLKQQIALIQQRLNGIRGSAIGQHNILSADHPDATPGAAAKGYIIRGTAGGKWERLAPEDDDDVLTLVAGTAEWVPAPGGAVTEDAVSWYDTFGDASIHWSWRTITGAGRTVAEAGGWMTLIVTNGTNAAWHGASNNAVRAWTNHVNNPPFEVVAKIDHVHMLADMQCGIFLAKDAQSAGGNQTVVLGRYGITGVLAEEQGIGNSAILLNTTDPHWLKIRVIGGEYRNQISFWHSTDGIAWTQLLTGGGAAYYVNDFWSSYGFNCGLFIRNWGAYLACEMNADDFKMVRCLGPR